MSTLLEQARHAHASRDWLRARECFTAARASGAPLSADDLYQLSDAAWWLGDIDEVLDACEAAYKAYIDENNGGAAAIAAMDIAMVLFLRGEEALGSGWMGRTQRLLDSEPECPAHGYFTYLTEVEGALEAVTPADAPGSGAVLEAAQRVQEIGRAHGDPNLVAAGMLGEARTLVKIGGVRAGLGLLDEVMLELLSDTLNPVWAGNIYCHLMAAAHELSDIRRARAWTDATERWLAQLPAAVVFNGICRVHRSQVHQISGLWDLAEQEAIRVCEELVELHTATAAEARYQVGEIRRLRGDLSGAESAYEDAHRLGRDPQPGLALLRLAQGRTEAASNSIRAALAGETRRLLRARLLSAQVDIALAGPAIDVAQEASGELDAIAAEYGSSGLEVAARHARGAVLIAGERPVEALPVLRDACRTWTDVDSPYDCARARVLMARALRALGDDEGADRELDTAIAVFTRLGAVVDAQRTAAVRATAERPGGLSDREAEVLTLVASGKTNRDVAAELSISERTVERHLSNIFTKLGVRTRTGAAAFAFERGLARPPSP